MTLGDCSFLNICFYVDSCKYVHYELDTYVDQTPNTVPIKFETTNEHIAGSKRHIVDWSSSPARRWINFPVGYWVSYGVGS